MQNRSNSLSRRSLLKGALAGAGASTLGWTSLFGISRAFAQDATGENDDTQTILNLAATAELFATTHYLAAIKAAEAGELDLDEKQIEYLKTGFLAEQDHLDLLVSLGAAPVVTEFYVPPTLFSDKAVFAATTEVAETTFVSAYLAATRIFVEAGAPQFAVTTAQIAGVEAEHRALARQIGGLLPNDRSYEAFQFANVSDAVPVLQPFLDGTGEGFIGPVSPPTADDIAGIRAQAEALGYTSDILPYAAMEMASAGQGEAAASGEGITVTAFDADVNIRATPSTEAAVVGVLAAGASTTVDGQRQGDDGMLWLHVASSGWLRSDTVSGDADAASLPELDA